MSNFFNNLTNNNYYTYFVIAAACIAVAIILYLIFKSPYKYPYFIYNFDVSGKRNPDIGDLIDEFIINGNYFQIENHNVKIQHWKNDCQKRISKSIFKNYRNKQYEKCIDDLHAYRFRLTRQQTRYKQSYYVKSSYKVTQIETEYSFDYTDLKIRNEKLKKINYESTLRDYQIKDQRKLITPILRKQIMERDNYTCQLCGKYMPDEVGLHIDHKVPVSKGGKSVPSNLQVLCSKCNGKKSSKI